MKAHILITISGGKSFLKEMLSYNFVREGHFLFGEWDLILNVEMSDPEELATFVQKIRENKDVKLTSTLIVAGE